ncbi:MAG: ribosome biogenesis GTP-binding protein YihA/YsxC [Polyangiaceae bacterium]
MTRVRVHEAAFAYGATALSQLPPPTIGEVAFAGRSNVGKSTLMNALMGRKNLVRTSRTPGATKAINFFKLTFEADLSPTGDTSATVATKLECHFVDLPGYGFAKVSKDTSKSWGDLLEGYLAERPTLRAMLLLVDARRGLEDDDRELLEYMDSTHKRDRGVTVARIVVATKLDKIPKSGQKIALQKVRSEAKLPGTWVTGVSGETGEGTPDLWRRIIPALTTAD